MTECRIFSRRGFLQQSSLSVAGIALSRMCRAQAEPAPPRFLKQWGKRGSAEGEFDIPIGIAINKADAVFVTEFRNNRVQKFDAEGKLLAVFKVMEQPGGIALDSRGNLYVSHLIPGKITVYDPTGKRLREFGKPGQGDGEFQQPGGMAFGRDGNLYIADQVNRRMQELSPRGEFIRKWGEYGVGPGQFGGNENRANRTGGPQFVAVDRQGNIYTTEASVGRIQKFTADGKYLLSWGNNSTEPGGFGGRPKNLPGPIAICLDREGRVWVSATNHRIQQFTSDGMYLRGWGVQGTEPGQFHTPHGLAIDSKGHLYVCDTQNARIQKFAP